MVVGESVRAHARRFRNGVAAVGVAAFASLAAAPSASASSAPPLHCGLLVCLDGFLTQVGLTNSYMSQRGVSSELATLIDWIQSRQQRAGLRTNFAAADSDDLDPRLLGYSSAKARSESARDAFAAYKAPRMASPNSNITYAVWGQGFYERENRSGLFLGTDIGRTTKTSGGIFGIDGVILGIRHTTDALVFGVLSGFTESRVRDAAGSTSRIEGPSFGVYGAYVDGNGSIDGVVKADFLDVRRSATGVDDLNVSMTNYSVSLNANKKVQLQNSWWLEPTVGFSYTRSVWNNAASALGFQDGTEVRIQGGARAGTSWTSGGVRVEPTFGAIAYSPVIVDGGSVATAGTPTAPTDVGKLFGLFNAKLNVVWSKYWATYVEGEARVSNNIDAYSGRIGGRWTFNPT